MRIAASSTSDADVQPRHRLRAPFFEPSLGRSERCGRAAPPGAIVVELLSRGVRRPGGLLGGRTAQRPAHVHEVARAQDRRQRLVRVDERRAAQLLGNLGRRATTAGGPARVRARPPAGRKSRARRGTADPWSRVSVSASSVSVVQPVLRGRLEVPTSNSAVAMRGRRQLHGAPGVAEHREDQRLQVVLRVDDVAERRVVDGGENRLRLTERLAADRPHVLDRHRIPLLRHDAARLHESVAEAQVAELRRAPQQQILREAAEAGEQHRGRRRALEQVVDGRDAAVGVAGRRRETEQVGRQRAIDRESGAGDGARPERIPVRPVVGGPQPLGVALELLDHRQQVVRDRRRLRALRVRVDGEDACRGVDRPGRAGARADRTTPPASSRMNSRCRIRYIVMSMSLRLRAVWSRPAASSPHALTIRRST